MFMKMVKFSLDFRETAKIRDGVMTYLFQSLMFIYHLRHSRMSHFQQTAVQIRIRCLLGCILLKQTDAAAISPNIRDWMLEKKCEPTILTTELLVSANLIFPQFDLWRKCILSI